MFVFFFFFFWLGKHKFLVPGPSPKKSVCTHAGKKVIVRKILLRKQQNSGNVISFFSVLGRFFAFFGFSELYPRCSEVISEKMDKVLTDTNLVITTNCSQR